MGTFRPDGLQLLPVNNKRIEFSDDRRTLLFVEQPDVDSIKFLYGAIDADKRIILPPATSKLSFLNHSADLILSENAEKKYSLINIRTGKVMPYFDYDFHITDFTLPNAYLAGKKGYLYALFSPEGERLTEAIYRSFYKPTETDRLMFNEAIIFRARKNNDELCGITNTGKEIIPQKSESKR